MILLGLDPGTRNPGLALLRRKPRIGGHPVGVFRYELLRSPVLNSLEDLYAELAFIHANPELHPSIVGIEGVAWANHVKKQGFGSGKILTSVGAVELFAVLVGAVRHHVQPQAWRRAVGVPTSGKVDAAVKRVASALIEGWKPASSSHRTEAALIGVVAGTVAGESKLLPGVLR